MTREWQVQRLFDEKASEWSAKYEKGGALAARLGRFSLAIMRLAPPPASVFDLGCGTANIARELATHGYRVVCADSSATMLDTAQRLSPGIPIEWRRLDPAWTELPFRDCGFDVVVASSVLEYVDAPDRVLGECARILRPGGVLVCTVPDPRHPIRRLEAMVAFLTGGPSDALLQRAPRFVSRRMRYLQLSRNRFGVAEWIDRAGATGLAPEESRERSSAHGDPLAMLIFRKGVATPARVVR